MVGAGRFLKGHFEIINSSIVTEVGARWLTMQVFLVKFNVSFTQLQSISCTIGDVGKFNTFWNFVSNTVFDLIES